MNNQWRHGAVRFAIPALPPEARQRGCQFERITFDMAVGPEWTVLFKEDAPQARAYPDMLDMFAHAGAFMSRHGPAGYLVWQIAAGTPQEVHVTHWIDLHEPAAIQMLTEAGKQSHLKLVIYDLAAQDVANMIEFQNNFGFDRVADGFSGLAENSDRGDFGAAVHDLSETKTLDQFLGRA
jgi:hypothetical protein